MATFRSGGALARLLPSVGEARLPASVPPFIIMVGVLRRLCSDALVAATGFEPVTSRL